MVGEELMERFNITLPPLLHGKAQEKAKREGKSLSFVIGSLLDAWIKKKPEGQR